MQRRTFAVLAVTIGLLVGILANVFFYDKQFGLSVPIYTAVVAGSIIALGVGTGKPINKRNLWPVIPLMFFAIMTAVRDDWMILWLDLAAIGALGAVLLHYVAIQRPLDEESFAEQTGSAVKASLMVIPYAVGEAGEAWSWLREARRYRGAQFTSVVRGLLIALPIIVVFVVLLGSADAVFASYVDRAWNSVRQMLGIDLMGDTVARLAVTVFFGALMTGAIGYSLVRGAVTATPAETVLDENGDPVAIPQHEEKRKPGFKLSMIESSIILGSVGLLFAAFVVIQFAYFFGGRSNITVEGLTYAQYARRGFFELVAVSGMTLGLALILDRSTVRHQGRENTLFRVLSVILVALTTVLLTSAAQRMWLYEEAYGFTQLRVYTHVAMVWLGVMFGVFVLALFRLRKNVFSLGTLLVLIGYVGTLNLMNVDAYIAERNIAKYHNNGGELDISFLNILSADAVPAILPLYQESEPGSRVRDWSGQWLARELTILADERNSNGATVFSWDAAREQAWAQLNGVRASLPSYDASLWYGWGTFWSMSDTEYEQYFDTRNTQITPGAP
jgi:hypothetical protein